MRARLHLPSLAAVLATALAATPHLAPAQQPAGRRLAVYRLDAPPRARLPLAVTVTDSAGSVVATYQPADRGPARPMTVSVVDSGLVLQGETPTGVLTVLLFPDEPEATARPAANAGGGQRVVGRWSLGTRGGRMYARPRS
jgi:hypothetical protein